MSNVKQEPVFERAGPELGADSDEILREFNYSEDAIEKLKTNGVIKNS